MVTPVKLPTIRPPVEQDKFDSVVGYEWADRITSFLKLLTDTLDQVINNPVNPPGFSSPLTTKGDVWGFNTINARIPVGADGQVLTADSTVPLGVSYKPSSSFVSPLTTKGDLFTFDTANQRLPVGTAGQILSADPAQTTGLKWIPTTSGVLQTWPYGYGSDGSVHLDGTATVSWATKVGSVYTMTACGACTDLIIDAGVRLVTACFNLYVSGTLTGGGLTAIISNDGIAGGIAGGGANAWTGAVWPATFQSRIWGPAAAPSNNGGNGGHVGAGIGVGGFLDGLGGSGGNGGAGLGTPGTTTPTTQANILGGLAQAQTYTTMSMGKYVNSGAAFNFLNGGGPGAGGFAWTGSDQGGGGGTGGGCVGVFARLLAGSFKITSIGGAGGPGNAATFQASGGGGGGGGFVLLVTQTPAPLSIVTIDVSGGVGGAAGGASSPGDNGTTGRSVIWAA